MLREKFISYGLVASMFLGDSFGGFSRAAIEMIKENTQFQRVTTPTEMGNRGWDCPL